MATDKSLDEIIDRLKKLKPEQIRQLETNADAALGSAAKWQPNPGPQTDAYYSEADVLLFGGQPGGGKSQLIIGLAFTAHQRTLIMRRKYGDLDRLIDDTLKVHGSRIGFNGSPPPRLRIDDKRVIDFAAAQYVGDEQSQMGKGRDLLGIDEATHFAEIQIRTLMGWVRTEDPKQRTRVVLATNPPLRPEGLWVTKMFAPWLDKNYIHPARPGELRWVISDDEGKDFWVDGPGEYKLGDGRMVKASSRTFIPSSVDDNPYYVNSDYKRQLDALPEPLRSLLMGGFQTEFKDAEHQLIPTAWIRAAMDRWTSAAPRGIPMCCIGVDASGGGTDPTVLARRHAGWYAPMIEIPAKDVPQDRAGYYTAGQIISYRRDSCAVIIDMGGGYGASTFEQLKANDIDVASYKGAEGSVRRSKDGHFEFANRRAEVYYRFREALDPSQPGGSPIFLPDDPALLADLAAPVILPDRKKIELEPKEKLKERLGRSPDRGDATVIAWSHGPHYVQGGVALERYHQYGYPKKRPGVIMGRLKYSLTKGRR